MSAAMMPQSRRLIYEKVVPPKTGFSRIVKKRQHVRIIDVMGKQVADVVFFNEHNTKEKHSNMWSLSRQWLVKPEIPYTIKDRLTSGDAIISSGLRPMMTIVADTPVPKGIHKVWGPSCCKELYEYLGYPGREGCRDIIAHEIAKYGISIEEIPETFDVFMRIDHDVAAGVWQVREPVSRPGDYIEFRAEMDCIVALSNCPMDVNVGSTVVSCNGDVCTPLKVEIYE